MQFILLCLLLNTTALFSAWFVNEPSCFVYDKPEDKAHIEDNLRYATPVKVTEIQKRWAFIEYGSRNGWILKNQLIELKEENATHPNAWVSYRGADVYVIGKSAHPKPIFCLPFETPVECTKYPRENMHWVEIKLQDGRLGYVLKTALHFTKPKLSLVDLSVFSQRFLGLNYVWGGTTSFGYDCSGFVQMLYRQIGIDLPRDAYEQYDSPLFETVNHTSYRVGDLIFCKNQAGKATHVGMMISPTTFIHAGASPPDTGIALCSIDESFLTDGSRGVYSYCVKRLKNTFNWFINKNVSIVYQRPDPYAQIEGMLPYSHKVEILDHRNDWMHIIYSGSEGWVKKDDLIQLSTFPKVNAWVKFSGGYVYDVPDTEWGYNTLLPFESGIEVIKIHPEQNNRWAEIRMQDGNIGYMMTNSLSFQKSHFSLEDLSDWSRKFLGTRFLWGGSTSFGFDSSGFIQMLFRQIGVFLPHSCYLQAMDNQFITIPMNQVKRGDLICMVDGKGKANHIGMMLNETEFIHSSAFVEIPGVSINSILDPNWSNGTYGHYGYYYRRLATP